MGCEATDAHGDEIRRFPKAEATVTATQCYISWFTKWCLLDQGLLIYLARLTETWPR